MIFNIWQKIVIITKYFKAICANLELIFYVNDTSILYLLTDVRRKGSNKHEVWQLSRMKKIQKNGVALHGDVRERGKS